MPAPDQTPGEGNSPCRPRQPLKNSLRLALWIGCGAAGVCLAQNILPNWDEGRDGPKGWRLVGTDGRRAPLTREGGSVLMVHGNGRDQNLWRTDGIALKPGSLYRLSFSGQGEGGDGEGAAFAGFSRVNRDFLPTESWQRYGFILSVPADATNDFIRLGEWHLKGNMSFSVAELLPVVAIHKRTARGTELGEAERVQGGSYRFKPSYNWMAGSYHRPLFVNRASFNSDRLVFASGAEIVYRLGPGACTQNQGRVDTSINYYLGGNLLVEASRDGTDWLPVATYDGQRRGGSVELPGGLFPAEEIFVRLSCQGTNGNLQVNSFTYESRLAEPIPDAEGVTHFLEVKQGNPSIAVSVHEIQEPSVDGHWRLECTLTNQGTTPLNVQGALGLDSGSYEQAKMQTLAPRTNAHWNLACSPGVPGQHDLTVWFRDQRGSNLFVGRIPVWNSFLADRRPGYPLAGTPDVHLWWCESGWKIGRERPRPEMPQGGAFEPARVSAARGEYEPLQVVLRPERDCRLTSVNMGPWRNARGEAGEISTQVNEVRYVRVVRPTDPSCRPGWYPDPLVPLTLPLELRGGQNLPLWITCHVSTNSKSGEFRGDLLLETSLGNLSVPTAIQVYDFQLPEETHLKSAIGLAAADINRYHRLSTVQDRLAVYEKYLLDFAQHRLSPNSFFDFAPIDVRFVGEGNDRHALIDFSRFDQAAKKWLDGYHFNSFRVPLRGMASGTFQSRAQGELDGLKQDTPEYTRLFANYVGQVEQHLREQNWLDKAYAYWFDEPAAKDFDFVAAGMKQLKGAAPALRRLLTTTPDPKLIGHVDIWCGFTHKWTPAMTAERRAAGEETWWYICTSPKAPYVTEFIDHPGTELRLWPWQSWQFGFSGILIWNAVYWTSPLAYPAPKLQDPWTDPMSYVSGGGFASGFVGVWGNGDGRFLYPPLGSAETNAGPRLDGPVNSVRWENLRDGMEDYEYFWLLKQGVARAAAARANPGLLSEARRLLIVPPEVSRDLTHFTTDPRPMLAHRDRVARMIEQLQRAGNSER